MKNSKVIITGGAGFIGSHLAEELAKQNQVIIIDDLSSGKKENIYKLLKQGNVQFLNESITNLDMLQKVSKSVEYIFHHAAIASVPGSIEDPITSHLVNATGTLNVLIAARDNKIKKFIFASSAAIYGNTPALPKREDMVPSPDSPYAVHKLIGEYYCKIFEQLYNLPTACLRYFNVYGPRQNPSSQYAAAIPNIIAKVSAGKPPIIFGDGEQTRDFVFVRDVVEANILVAQSTATGVFNIGGGKSLSINELAETIIDIIGANLKPIHFEPRPGDIKHSLADIARAKEIGYHPKYQLEEGLSQTIANLFHTFAINKNGED